MRTKRANDWLGGTAAEAAPAAVPAASVWGAGSGAVRKSTEQGPIREAKCQERTSEKTHHMDEAVSANVGRRRDLSVRRGIEYRDKVHEGIHRTSQSERPGGGDV